MWTKENAEFAEKAMDIVIHSWKFRMIRNVVTDGSGELYYKAADVHKELEEAWKENMAMIYQSCGDEETAQGIIDGKIKMFRTIQQ